MNDNIRYYEILAAFLQTCNTLRLMSDKEYRTYWRVIQESWVEPDENGIEWHACYTSDIEKECRRVLSK